MAAIALPPNGAAQRGTLRAAKAVTETLGLTLAVGYGVLWGLETGLAVWVRRAVKKLPPS